MRGTYRLIPIALLLLLTSTSLSATSQAASPDDSGSDAELAQTSPDTLTPARLGTSDGQRRPGKAQRMQHGVPVSRHPTGALLRSILVPGWGQLYTGHPFKALGFFATDVGMIYGAIYQHNAALDYQRQADETKSEVYRTRLRKSADFYRSDRNKLIWWTAGVTLLAGFDAYVEAHLFDFRIDPALGTTPSGDGMTTGLTITLPLRK